MPKKSYHYNVEGFGLMLHTGDNAVRVRRNLHSIGWWTWLRPKRKRAADAPPSAAGGHEYPPNKYKAIIDE